jgi:hypothetical protein
LIKGTTPTLHFNLPIETKLLKAAEIVLQYVDNAKTVTIERKMEECKVGEKSIAAVLTQEETLALPAPALAKVQIRVKTEDDLVLASPVFEVTVKELLKESVIE